MVIQRAYLAGILDGEGCIGLRFVKGKYITIMVQVSNTDRRLVDWLQEHYGGSVYVSRDLRPTRKVVYLWCVAAKKARAVLQDALPYLIVKREQADTVLALPVRSVGAKLAEIDIARNLEARAKMQQLNRRGA